MKMAKATQQDMDAAYELCHALEALEQGYLPNMTGDEDEESVSYEERKHAIQVVNHLIAIARRASIFRVCFGMTVLLDSKNEIVDPNSKALDLHPRLQVCKKACEGIPDEKLQSWINPPEGQLGAPHGTWAQQLAAAGHLVIQTTCMLDTLCNGLTWNIENHPDVMNESDAEALQAARSFLEKFRVES